MYGCKGIFACLPRVAYLCMIGRLQLLSSPLIPICRIFDVRQSLNCRLHSRKESLYLCCRFCHFLLTICSVFIMISDVRRAPRLQGFILILLFLFTSPTAIKSLNIFLHLYTHQHEYLLLVIYYSSHRMYPPFSIGLRCDSWLGYTQRGKPSPWH